MRVQAAAGLVGIRWALTDENRIVWYSFNLCEDETVELAFDLDTGTDVE